MTLSGNLPIASVIAADVTRREYTNCADEEPRDSTSASNKRPLMGNKPKQDPALITARDSRSPVREVILARHP